MSCLLCGKTTTNPKFCNRSCAAKWTNVMYPKRKRTRTDKCPNCSNYKHLEATICTSCHKLSEQERLSNMTLEESLNLDGAQKSKYNTVRHHARKYANELVQFCQVCGYTKAVQVCHIKPIASFPLDTLIQVINDPSNIAILCPNHHWELDHNLLEEPLM